jgi:alkanesulfonate monooxygenase SsuD/methylene tetrahydromethanopterin reductase-like flavin-dependent oxidoreductase (luciferase family)
MGPVRRRDEPPRGSKGGDRSLRLAVRHADGWNTVWRWSQASYAERIARARELCAEAGRDPATFRLSIGLYSVVGEDERDLARRWDAMHQRMPRAAAEPLERFASDTLSGTVERVRARVAGLADLGVDEIVISPAILPFAIWDPSMVELLASAVVRAA